MKTLIIFGFLLTIIATVTALMTGVTVVTQLATIAGIVLWLGCSFVYINLRG